MKVKTNGTVLNYEVEGPEGAAWIVVSHGIATSLEIWTDVSRELKSKYRVLRYDARGHGGRASKGSRRYGLHCALVTVA